MTHENKKKKICRKMIVLRNVQKTFKIKVVKEAVIEFET